MDIHDYAYYGDILALPFFLSISIYFMTRQRKTMIEFILLIFNVLAFIIDTILVINVNLSKTYTTIVDTIAIPFFSLMVYYFYTKKNLTIIENIFFIFSIITLCIDIILTYQKMFQRVQRQQ